MAFIGYRKTFDTLWKPSIIEVLENQQVERDYVDLMKHIYIYIYIWQYRSLCNTPSYTTDIKINRGIWQSNTMSPVLFTTCLQDLFRRLNWEEKGIKVYGEHLSSLKFADHIFLFADNLETLHKMIEELQKENIKAGLNINIAKTEIIANKCINDTWKITINDEETKKTQ